MPYIEVSSLDDARLDAYARLTEAQLRNKLEPQLGLFIAESEKVIDRALEGGMHSVSMLMTPDWVEPTRGLVARASRAYEGEACAGAPATSPGVAPGQACAPASAMSQAAAPAPAPATSQAAATSGDFALPVFVLPAEEAHRLTGFTVTRGILMACRRPALPSVEELLARAEASPAHPAGAPMRIAVLDGIVDHTNVGAIFRSAAALGVDAVLATPTCCDPLYRRAVRVSMGTVFQVPWTRIGTQAADWPAAGLAQLHELGYATAAMALSDDSIPLGSPELAACDKLALVFGTEGDGLARRTIEGCDFTVRIPMKHGVDSLNVAAASAVAFWELRARD